VATIPESVPGTRRYTEHIIYELAKSIRERDMLTYDHSRRVAIYANRLARHLGWSRRAAYDLSLAGLVHDLGKTWIKNAVLHKESALSADEREEMERHPVIAARILQIYAAPEPLVGAVLHHHEAYDGHGYPAGLAGAAIPLGARILTIADVFDALTSARPYKAAMRAEEARDWISAHAGSNFDPMLVRTFASVLNQRPDFQILPLVESLVPLETPDGWVEDDRGLRLSQRDLRWAR
jgi:putative two-component system response regulator